VVSSFVYLALCRLVQLVALLCKSERSKNSRSSCSDMSWRSCVGSRGERAWGAVDRAVFAALARALPRSAWTTLSVRPRRCCAGTESWSGGAGLNRTGGRGGRGSIVGCKRLLCGSNARTRLRATGESSANCRASASVFRRARCGRSSSVMACRRRRSETSSPGAASCASRRRRRSPELSSPSKPPG